MNFSKRDRKIARPLPGTKQTKSRVLICCEGKNSEPQYLTGYQDACSNLRYLIEFGLCGADPLALVKFAISKNKEANQIAKKGRDSFRGYDFVYCVYDRDEHAHWAAANDMAAANGINVIKSVPSFELWLLLHFVDSPGAQHRHELTRRLGEFVTHYDRDAKSVDFSKFRGGYDDARKRAEKIVEQALDIGEPNINPITYFHELTAAIGFL